MATVLAYWVVPATLFLFWLRYLVRQDFRGTLLHAFLLTLSVAAATCVPTIVARVLQPGDLFGRKRRICAAESRDRACGAADGLCSADFFAWSESRLAFRPNIVDPQHSQANLLRWASEAMQSIGYRPYAELTESTLSGPPPHGNWSAEALPAVPGAKLNEMNLRFARAYKSYLVNAKFWRANLEGAYLSEVGFARSQFTRSRFTRRHFDRVKASNTVMVSADARRANFTGADLSGADLSFATLENALLSNARLEGASLYARKFAQRSIACAADLTRADMRDTRMERSVFPSPRWPRRIFPQQN